LGEVLVPQAPAEVPNVPPASPVLEYLRLSGIAKRLLIEGVRDEFANRMAGLPALKDLFNVQIKLFV